MSAADSTPVSVPALKCRRCGKLDPGPRLLCPACHAPTMDPVEVRGSGVLVSWTVIRRAPARFKDQAPYTVCVVDLGDGVRTTGRLAQEGAVLAMGAGVRCVARESGVAIFSTEA